MIGDDGNIRAALQQPAQPLERFTGGQGCRDQDAGDAPQGHGFRFADGGAGDAERARGHDPLPDLDAFMGLGMGAQPDAALARPVGHDGDVAVEDVDIDEKGRRGNVGAPHRRTSRPV